MQQNSNRFHCITDAVPKTLQKCAVQCFCQGTTVACAGLVVMALPPDLSNNIHDAPASSQSGSVLLDPGLIIALSC